VRATHFAKPDPLGEFRTAPSRERLNRDDELSSQSKQFHIPSTTIAGQQVPGLVHTPIRSTFRVNFAGYSLGYLHGHTD
jgi:hypothetical protein